MKKQDDQFLILFLTTILFLVIICFLALMQDFDFYQPQVEHFSQQKTKSFSKTSNLTGGQKREEHVSANLFFQQTPIGDVKKKEINVAAYYLTGWGVKNDYPRSQDLSIGTQLHPVLGRDYAVDEAGTYDAGNPEVAKQHIKWADNYGVDTFIVEYMYPGWEWEKNLESGLLQASNIDKINFALQYDATPHLPTLQNGEWLGDLHKFFTKTATTISYIESNYFDHPSYLKHNGKPIVFLYHAHVLYNKLGRSNFDKFIGVIRNATNKELYLVGDIMNENWLSWKENVFLTRRFDAVTSYNMPSSGQGYTKNQEGDLEVIAPFEKLVQGYITRAIYWSHFSNSQNRDFIPPLLTGFSNLSMYKAGYDDWLAVREGSSPVDFEKMAQAVKKYIDPDLNMIVVCAWNEFQEAAALEPTVEYNFSYLEVIRSIFGG